MLVDLRIRHLAIIDDLEVRFASGFNVISGETGAGKSIILHGLGLALGARASADMVRAGADAAHVEASFEPGADAIAFLHEQAIAADPGEPVVMRRVVTARGRSRSFVNGTSVPAATLRALGAHLVDYASQHESAVLLDEARHRDILDRFAGCEAVLAGLANQVRRLRDAEARRRRLEASEAERRRELELLTFQRDELVAADLHAGVIEASERELEVIRSAEQLQEAVAAAEQGLYSGPGSAVDRVHGALAAVESFAGLDDELGAVHDQLQEALYGLEDGARALGGIAGRVQDDPVRMEELEERVAELRALLRKHGTDEDGLIGRAEELDREIGALEASASELGTLGGEVDGIAREAAATAEKLSRARRRAAERMGNQVASSLAQLAMGGARFEVAVEPDPAGLSETGTDGVAFRLSANPGEPMRPLARVASGGELSRVLLAVKDALQDAAAADSFVLDEIDTGIGGSVADVLGGQLERLAQRRQLIVITHLPQIAARAGAHYRVGKRSRDGRTTVWARRLDDAARVDEVARMVAGTRHADRSRALADEMLGASGLEGGSPSDARNGDMIE